MDYFEAMAAIAAILAAIPDDQLPEVVIEQRDDVTIAWDEEKQIGYHLGSSTINGRPAPAPHREDAASQALTLESVHRAETRWWMQHGAALAGGGA